MRLHGVTLKAVERETIGSVVAAFEALDVSDYIGLYLHLNVAGGIYLLLLLIGILKLEAYHVASRDDIGSQAVSEDCDEQG